MSARLPSPEERRALEDELGRLLYERGECSVAVALRFERGEPPRYVPWAQVPVAFQEKYRRGAAAIAAIVLRDPERWRPLVTDGRKGGRRATGTHRLA